jgi:hypothetical protein
MPPSLDSAVASDWPTTESPLGTPSVWLWRLLIGLFFCIGLCLASRLIPRVVPLPPAEWYATAIMGGAFIAFALMTLLAVLADHRAHRPFTHASDHVLPAVPRQPLLRPGQISFSFVTHCLVPTPGGLRLDPTPGPFRRNRVGMYLWINIVAAGVTALVWWKSESVANRLSITAGIGLAFFAIGNLVVSLVDWLMRREQHKLCTLDINLTDGRITLGAAGDTHVLSRDQVLAVQLCAAQRKVGQRRGHLSSFAALELNLVWTEACDPGQTSPVRRATLLNLSGGYHRAVPIARQIAEALTVPLLNHATAADWELERRTAKLREPEPTGGFM